MLNNCYVELQDWPPKKLSNASYELTKVLATWIDS